MAARQDGGGGDPSKTTPAEEIYKAVQKIKASGDKKNELLTMECKLVRVGTYRVSQREGSKELNIIASRKGISVSLPHSKAPNVKKGICILTDFINTLEACFSKRLFVMFVKTTPKFTKHIRNLWGLEGPPVNPESQYYCPINGNPAQRGIIFLINDMAEQDIIKIRKFFHGKLTEIDEAKARLFLAEAREISPPDLMHKQMTDSDSLVNSLSSNQATTSSLPSSTPSIVSLKISSKSKEQTAKAGSTAESENANRRSSSPKSQGMEVKGDECAASSAPPPKPQYPWMICAMGSKCVVPANQEVTLLPCLHVLCSGRCFDKFLEEVKPGSSLECRVCRTRIDRNKLTNKIIPDKEFGVEEKFVEEVIICENCIFDLPATSYCQDCPSSLCNDCVGLHPRARATANHIIQPNLDTPKMKKN